MDDPLNVAQGQVPEFDYDVFVSYAHDDNTLPDGTKAKFGWITALARNLNVGPNALRKRIFIDHQLRIGDDFDKGLVERVERSAVLLLVLSRRYVESSWCGKEVDHFVRARSDDPANPQNIIVVELLPYERLEAQAKVPETIRKLRERRLFANFWYWHKSAGYPRVAGFPTPMEDEDGSTHYWQQRDALLQGLDGRLLELKAARRSPIADGQSVTPATASALGQSAPPGQAKESAAAHLSLSAQATDPGVFLADTTEDLDESRHQVKIALQAEGIAVLPETDYSSVPVVEVEAAVGAHVAASRVFVQLLSPTVGKARGARLPAPQLQFELAQRAGLPIMQWCDNSVSIEGIADAGHKALLRSGFLHSTNLEQFKSEVIAKQRTLVREAQRASAQSEHDRPAGKRRIFLDDWLSEGELAGDLRAQLKRSGCEVRSLDPDEATNDEALIDMLRSCRGGISIYPNRRHRSTLKHRLVHFLDLIAEKQLQVARWGVYFAQPSNPNDIYKEFRLDSDDLLPIGGVAGTQAAEFILQGFLEGVPV